MRRKHFTPEEIERIVALAAQGLTSPVIAARMESRPSSIQKVLKRASRAAKA